MIAITINGITITIIINTNATIQEIIITISSAKKLEPEIWFLDRICLNRVEYFAGIGWHWEEKNCLYKKGWGRDFFPDDIFEWTQKYLLAHKNFLPNLRIRMTVGAASWFSWTLIKPQIAKKSLLVMRRTPEGSNLAVSFFLLINGYISYKILNFRTFNIF